jgi:hypothetical protein
MKKTLILFAALVACASATWATPVLDQTSGVTGPFTSRAEFGRGIPQADTFTVGLKGRLVQLVVSGSGSGGVWAAGSPPFGDTGPGT